MRSQEKRKFEGRPYQLKQTNKTTNQTNKQKTALFSF